MTTSRLRSGRTACLAAILALGVTLSACSSSGGSSPGSGTAATKGEYASLRAMVPAAYKSSGVIRLATDFAEPPLMYSKGSTPPGLVFSVTDEIASRLGLQIEPVLIADSSAWPTALSAGRVDMLATFNDTTVREQTYDIVDWAYNSTIFVVPYGNPKHITTWADVCGLKVGVISGTSEQLEIESESNRCVADGKPAVHVLTYASLAATRLALQSGQINLQLDSGIQAPYAAAHADGGKLFTTIPGSLSFKVPMGLGFRKSDAGLAAAVEAALKSMVADGTYAKLFAEYGLSYAARPDITEDHPASAVPKVAPQW
jgi:polar amino acid transport system substrate-binding protein